MRVVDAERHLVEVAALWACGLAPSQHVVDAAVALVVEGSENAALIRLAGATRRESDFEVAEILATVMSEAGYPYWGKGNDQTEVVACAALISRAGADVSSVREVCSVIHQRFGHQCHRRVEVFSNLDDRFDCLPYVPQPDEEQLMSIFHRESDELATYVDGLLADEGFDTGDDAHTSLTTRTFEAIVWVGDRPGERVAVAAQDPAEATTKLRSQFGDDVIISAWNAEDADRPR